MPITGQIRGAKKNKIDTSERLLGGVSFDLITPKGIFLLYDKAKKTSAQHSGFAEVLLF
jgi:hypothetical protein